MPAMVCTALLSAAFAMLAVRPRNRAAAKMPIELRMAILLGNQPNNRTYTAPACRSAYQGPQAGQTFQKVTICQGLGPAARRAGPGMNGPVLRAFVAAGGPGRAPRLP